MGKSDFKKLYSIIKSELGPVVTCKTSYFCDRFDPSQNYAGVVVHSVNKKFQWVNEGGRANRYNGKSFYVIVHSTAQWPDQYKMPDGQGLAHDYLLKNVMGLDYDRTKVTCSGFSYVNGGLVFDCKWLNATDQSDSKSDGNQGLTEEEKILVKFCFEKYKEHGPHHIFNISDEVDRALSG